MPSPLRKIIPVCLVLLLLGGCTHTPPRERSEALREIDIAQALLLNDADALGTEAVLTAALGYLDGPGAASSLVFGPETISAADYRLALGHLLAELRRDPDAFRGVLAGGFTAFEVFGRERWGEIDARAFAIPRVKGSRTRTADLSEPLYAPPSDLVRIRFSEYSQKFPNLAALSNSGDFTYGRVRDSKRGSGEIVAVEPYYSRAEIESKGLLAKKRLELAWLAPADAERIREAGSGEIEFGDESAFAAEAATNGRKRSAKADFFPFYRLQAAAPASRLGAAYVDGRTIAADYAFYPKGAIAFLTRAEGANPGGRYVATLEAPREALGPGRIDLYLGRGADADPGLRPARLVFFAPTPTLLDRLRRDSQGKAATDAGTNPAQ